MLCLFYSSRRKSHTGIESDKPLNDQRKGDGKRVYTTDPRGSVTHSSLPKIISQSYSLPIGYTNQVGQNSSSYVNYAPSSIIS